jgi:hypothetical protein
LIGEFKVAARNRKTADALGLTIPHALFIEAAKVIE